MASSSSEILAHTITRDVVYNVSYGGRREVRASDRLLEVSGSAPLI